MIADKFVLVDPVGRRIEGKNKALEAIEGIFQPCEGLDFRAKKFLDKDENTTIIEFILLMDDTKLDGIDVIEWQGDTIKELRSHLDIPCPN